MNNVTKWFLGIGGALVIGAALVVGGIYIGQGLAFRQAANTGYYGMMGSADMMDQFSGQTDSENTPFAYGWGMMNGRGIGMMNDFSGEGTEGYSFGMMGPGMMGPGMMNGYSSGLVDVEPLTIGEAEEAINDYLADTGDENLELHEIMIFEGNAYGIVVEESTGISAMEVLVDPVTSTVYPEPGPNMMWNLKYGMMSGDMMGGDMMGGGMMGGGMMGRDYNRGTLLDVSADMSVSEEEAVELAQAYLDEYIPGTEADEHADAFYGYYTLHVLRDGEVAGMLSVNGYTGEVWLHTWHGDFIEMAE